MAYDPYYGSYYPPAATASDIAADAGDVWVETTSAYYDGGAGSRCGIVGGANDDSNPKDNFWWSCDFGEGNYMTLDGIALQFRSSQYVSPMQLWNSNDGENWTLVDTFSGHAGGAIKFEFAESTARFWLLGDTKSSAALTVRIYWLRFYGVEGSAPGGGGRGGSRWAVRPRSLSARTRRF